MLFQQEFAETKLATKFDEFHLRVYPDAEGKEHIVLWTDNLDLTQPVLVRVHSECLTGDLFGSLHCDCGQQLAKSLQMISEQGGVLIYLRQEGRGIGLFEKIKSYQLQSKGFDTVEANVLLGHQPDQRSYEMVKKIFDDLNISRIQLLTNNPSKVSEIAKFGIEVVERIPLISRANKHNKLYLETKRKKFQHFISKSSQSYFYQFQIYNITEMDSIAELVAQKNKDPLLKIAVGVAVNHHILYQDKEVKRVTDIINFCKNNPDLTPIIHFSCLLSPDVLKDIKSVKQLWPEVTRIQLNDFKLEIPLLKKICEIFQVDIPLSDENFEVVHEARFREIAKKNKSFIVLDNSKGRGIKENKDSYIRRIDALLSYGLNDITLSGGFGPDRLDTYFEIRRFYRINFSIDAETNLKTLGQFDVEKIKLYLVQLIRFDDPKRTGIDQTKKFLNQCSRSDWERTTINNYEFVIHPKVFHSGCFPSTAWFASELCTLLKGNSNFCEIGCGAGVISCLVALSNTKLQVTATDINPYASENTQKNAKNLGLRSRISVHVGDVLDSIDSDKRFDSIFWALPFGFLDPGVSINLEEAQVFDPGYRAIRKLLQTARQYLVSGGKLFLGFSSDLGHYELLESFVKDAKATIRTVAKTTIQENAKVLFEILEISYEKK